MSRRRDWYVAIGDMSGEYEGNPLAFDASSVYGPFTAKQAIKLSAMADGFPHASYGVEIFRRSPGTFRDVARLIREKKAEAIADARRDAEQMELNVRAAR